MTPEDDRQRAARIGAELAEVGSEFVAEVDKLVPIANRLNDLVATQRAIDGRLGRHRYGPSAIELAASVVLGRLSALRSALPYESSAAADAAAGLLCHDRQLELAADAGEAPDSTPAESW